MSRFSYICEEQQLTISVCFAAPHTEKMLKTLKTRAKRKADGRDKWSWDESSSKIFCFICFEAALGQ